KTKNDNILDKTKNDNILDKTKNDNILDLPEVIAWIDFMSEKIDLLEIERNEFLADYDLSPKNLMFYQDIILPMCENTLFLDNIAQSENICYEDYNKNRLIIKVFVNGSELTCNYNNLCDIDNLNCINYPYNFPYFVKHKLNDSIKDENIFNDFKNNFYKISLESDKHKHLKTQQFYFKTLKEAFNVKEICGNDIEVCLSSEHSLYSIIENFIRNSAKHNKRTLENGQNLEIIININDKIEKDKIDSDYFTFQIYDNVSNTSKDTLNKINESIKEETIKNQGLVEKNMGILDLKINAFLLKTRDEITEEKLKETIKIIVKDNNNKEFKEFKELIQNNNDNTYNFGYEFKLCKPKKILWINKDFKNENKNGITYSNSFNFLINNSNSHNDNETTSLANYQFAIIELNTLIALKIEDKFEYDKILCLLPHRVLINGELKDFEDFEKLNKDENIQIIDELINNKRIFCIHKPINKPIDDDNTSILISCWENWLRKWISKDKKGMLYIYLENNELVVNWYRNDFKFESEILKFQAFNSEDAIKNEEYV
ncbi:MAG: hypothetical protein QM539_08325, partial [Alphaproteobacteria bacterium]|nr:hypothetical protein [Alphaproteobacteria bacterium]